VLADELEADDALPVEEEDRGDVLVALAAAIYRTQ